MTRWEWRPIPNCDGRFVLFGAARNLSIEALAGPDADIFRFHVKEARDTVAVVSLRGGGIISYERADGTAVHTLNEPEGFSRKLHQLGIRLPSDR